MTTRIETHGNFPSGPDAMRILMEEGHRAVTRSVMLHEAEWKRRAARARRTGHMLRSITHRVTLDANQIVGQVGTNVPYARYLEEGTGLYGPRNRWIVPKRAKALRFPQPGNAGFTLAGRVRQRGGAADPRASFVYASRVRGIRPRRFARDAALVVQPRVHAEFVQAGQRAVARLSEGS